jgi:N-methylhydantoinase A/acetophenone carboxylase
VAAEIRAFAPALGPLVSNLAGRPWSELAADPSELARVALQARQVAGATHLVVPLHPAALVAACGVGAKVVDDAIDLSGAAFGPLEALEPEAVLASPWLAPMVELARIAARQAGVPVAARLPSPRSLAAALRADPADAEALLAAADLCSAAALELLRAGASLLLVDGVADPGADGSDDSVELVARTARPFGVPVVDTYSSGVTALVLPLVSDARTVASRPGDQVLVTARPVRADDDLARLRELGTALAGAATGPAAEGSAAATGGGLASGRTPPAQARGGPRQSRATPASTERFSVGIDMGGTFTDAYATSGGRSVSTKVPTLRFDLTRSLVASLRSVADALALDAGAFVRRVAVLKVATTIGTNAVVEGTGTRVGVLVGRGHESDLYGPGRPDALFETFVRPDDVLVIDPAADGDEILAACRELVANGVRQVVVALPRSGDTHADENRVRTVIRERYPEHYLRSVPLQLSTDVTAAGEDDVRAATAVVNAYLHRDMAHLLARAEQELRAIGLDVPVLVVHASSGVARVATSIALGTYSAGPSAGLSGAEDVAQRLGDRLVITADMGGTTLDLGMVRDGRCEVELRPTIAGVRVALPMNRTASFGIGGGSIVTVEADGTITVGPESAGAVPGPAAFGRGGRLPTVTDVDIVAGLLEDGSVLGGEVTLSGAAARDAIQDVAGKLGVSVETAAARIEAQIDHQIGMAMAGFLDARDVQAADVTLYAFGGAGPLHFGRAATVAGIRRLRTFPFGGVFSAFGCTAVDVRHRYEVLVPGDGMDRDSACAAVEGLLRRAGWDLRAEGFATRSGTCRLVADGADGRQLAATQPVELGQGAATSLVEAAWPLPTEATTLAVVVDVPTRDLGVARAAAASNEAMDGDPQARDGSQGEERTVTVWWSDSPTTVLVIEARDLPRDLPVPGPLLVRDGETAACVPPEWTVRREPDGSLLWERAE